MTNPAGVGTRGIGMTAERVTSGLVEGLYGSKYRIEAEVRAVVPNIIAQLEQRMTLTEVDQVVSSVWPIPVYQPRVRVWFQDIGTDDQGITLILGVTAAAVTPDSAPKQPKWAAKAGRGLAEVPKTRTLTVGLAPSALAPIAEMLVERGTARINVLDTPVESLKKFADPKQVAELIPDLKRHGDSVELWAELVLSKPLGVSDADGKMQFDVPGLIVSVAMKPNQEAKDWQPYAELQFDISQPATPRVFSPSSTSRAIEMAWDQEPQIKVSSRFAPGYKAEDDKFDEARLKELFLAGWKEWTQSGPTTHVSIPDIDLGYTKLRLKDVAWSAPSLTAVFGNPGVRLSNMSKEPVIYETKGPYSDWSKPFTLKEGDYDYYNIAYPLMFRRQTPAGQFEYFTLPVGSHSEFRRPLTGDRPQLFQARETAAPAPPPPAAASK